ncbi:YybH family protein [Nocardia sp. NPDC052316]|uniref:YybH family protein n=1 Tax=Nocardia sp. NPDC052316 TaxID=3364329 RepID=UPI0037CBC928
MTTDHDAALADSAPNPALAQHIAQWVELFNARDLTGLAGLYEPDSIVVPRPGHPAAGQHRAAALAHLAGMGLPMRAALRLAYTAGDIALLLVDWSMQGTMPDGHEITLHGTATDVARRGADGRWRYVIDNPAGIAT